MLGFPTLMDGGTITAPNIAIWTQEEGWIVENEGVPPDKSPVGTNVVGGMRLVSVYSLSLMKVGVRPPFLIATSDARRCRVHRRRQMPPERKRNSALRTLLP